MNSSPTSSEAALYAAQKTPNSCGVRRGDASAQIVLTEVTCMKEGETAAMTTPFENIFTMFLLI